MHCFPQKMEVIKVSKAITRKAGVAETPESGSLDPPSVVPPSGSSVVSAPDPPSEHGGLKLALQFSYSCVVLISISYSTNKTAQHPKTSRKLQRSWHVAI